MSDWCILRTAPSKTLNLAASLAEDGYDVWTPVEVKKVVGSKVGARLALLPSYVFVRRLHLVDMLQLATMRVKPRRGAGLLKSAHVDFSVMHAFGGIPLVAEQALAPLRRLEHKRTPRKRAEYAFPRGAKVRLSQGVGAGLIGEVLRSSPAKTFVAFGGMLGKVEVETSILLWDDVRTGLPCGSDVERKAA